MRIVVSSAGEGKSAQVDPRFGRCPYFVFVDTETEEVVTRVNDAVMSGHGAGVQAAQFVAQEGADVAISGHLGPNAYQVLAAAGVETYQSPDQTVAEAVAAFEAGELTPVSGPTGPAHAGSRRR